MPYIPPDSIFDPGAVIGDTKTIETRGVYIEVDGDGYPVDKGLIPGVACWIEHVNGVSYARPYPPHDLQNVSSLHNPFGIVLRVYARDPAKPYQLNQNENTAIIAVSGTVGLKFAAKLDALPGLGDRVSPYGGNTEHETKGWPSLGICDGISHDGSDSVIAVRILPQGDAGGAEFGKPLISECIAEGAIRQYDWVYASNVQAFAQENKPLTVKTYTDGDTNKAIYGLALEGKSDGQHIKVLYYGIGYVPYVYKTTAILAGLDKVNGGELPKTFRNRIKRNDGSVGEAITSIITVGTLIGTAIDVGCGIYRMFRGGSSPAKCFDDIRQGTAQFQQLLAAENGAFEVTPDGYQGLFVNPGLMAPATLTEAPPLVGSTTSGNTFIAEGIIYSGGDSGVKEISRQSTIMSGTSFYGVSAPKYTDDPEVNPPVSGSANPEPSTQRIRVIREGVANILANGNWKQGDYIDLFGRAIPERDEDIVPHVGKALEATIDGKLGPVEISPYDPNQYAIIDHCKLVTSPSVDPGDSVNASITTPGTSFSRSIIARMGATVAHMHTGVDGVLVRFDEHFYSDGGDYDGRAVIQIGGYYPFNAATATSVIAGDHISHMHNGLSYVIEEDPDSPTYMNILGIVIRTEGADRQTSWWIKIEPRTQYFAPLSSGEE